MGNTQATPLLTAAVGALICTGALYYANSTSNVEIPQHVVDSFTAFKAVHNKVYATQAEHNFRLATFHANYLDAEEHNAKNLGSTRGVTKFSDLTKQEFKKMYLGYKKNAARKPIKKAVVNKKLTTGDVDWRGSLTTAVKDQGQCGSCWAFSATEQIESAYIMATGNSVSLSAQQITSCDTSDLGCNGGDTVTAYEYVESAGGIDSESNYPYTSGTTMRTGRCQANSSEYVARVTGYSQVSGRASEESAMMSQIMTSPMSVCVDAETWQTYTGGVVTSSTCGTDLDHCVQVVGIQDGAWIVRNSWASDWGENGYIRVRAGQNACGIAMEATIVTASGE